MKTMTSPNPGEVKERSDKARKAAAASRGKNRLKGRGHPTTAEMDYSSREMEFMNAIQEYKRVSGRQFPTWAEVLRVVDSLGYLKHSSLAVFVPSQEAA